MTKRLERIPLVYHLTVMNRDTHETFGFLGNITTQGVLLFCPQAVPLNTVFALDMNLPFPIDGTRSIPFSARSVWCAWEAKLGLYAAGFQMESEDPGRSKLIVDAIAALGGKNHALRESQTE